MLDVVFEKKAKKFGKSSHVVLPVDYIGEKVRVVVPRQLNLREGVLQHLLPRAEHVIGAYLIGSYARGEQEEDSDVDVLVVSDEPFRIHGGGRYHFTVLSEEEIQDAVRSNPLSMHFMISEAKPILNSGFLKHLKEVKVSIRGRWYLESTESALNVVRGFLDLEKEEGNEMLTATSCIYSLLLRLRLLYLLKCVKQNRGYTNREFLQSIENIDRKRLNEMYRLYRLIRDGRPVVEHDIRVEDAEGLYTTALEWLREAEG